jgi:hypothetical protein
MDEIHNMLLEAGFCNDNVLRDRLGKFFKIVLTPYAASLPRFNAPLKTIVGGGDIAQGL